MKTSESVDDDDSGYVDTLHVTIIAMEGINQGKEGGEGALGLREE